MQENRKWLEKLIKENKESSNELTYTYCPFEVLYQLQQENQKQKEVIDKAIEYIEYDLKSFLYGIEYRTLIKILKGDVNG